MKKQSIIIFFGAFLITIFTYAISSTYLQKKWIAPTEADKIINPLKGNRAAINQGKLIFNKLCVVCHGTKGKGDGIAGLALNPRPKNLSSYNVQKQTDGAIFWKITTGQAPMASYKKTLSENDRWSVINFLRTLK